MQVKCIKTFNFSGTITVFVSQNTWFLYGFMQVPHQTCAIGGQKVCRWAWAIQQKINVFVSCFTPKNKHIYIFYWTRLIFYFFLLLTVSCLPQSFDVRMSSFRWHYCIPVIWWVYDIDATIGVMLKMFFFFSYLCDHVQTPIL